MDCLGLTGAMLLLLSTWRGGASRSERPPVPNHSKTMDLEKVTEFDRLLPEALQSRILEATQLACRFFAGSGSQRSGLVSLTSSQRVSMWMGLTVNP